MNVYEASRKRIQYAISEFDNIIVSFSGGKDSGVMLNLTLDIAKEMKVLHKCKGVFIMRI
ncbi:phosphoadenosine phosphosulfate reductase family protein [Fusobacterium necrophorum]|uniref:Phosphoadenosine phosphosulfate reductase family protein n=1 Tax=Fusobacterium necrophorum TaxID=859 RepID=A0AAW6W979_9FUSO|nr:phosphoadenosine phosphosulfate reductase family protein [Fusobacterium necrophorum]MDK4482030.1 phosphoadenosine phosphosulfate reductase family protein [Fusobacterium necrophorum]MDK4511145.1 phosphoadenosine phosphosulfate reductase family protein [Fusobacterium necrophorum]